ncbi:MAG: hypothetical protein LUH15_10835 [Tannerellaceae bacterium]|nr:hypothetical protein [Tannerellaceae bacterium]
MRKIASHYILVNRLYRLHYLKIEGNKQFAGLFPLEQEEAGIEFYNGLLWVVSAEENGQKPWEEWGKQYAATPLGELLQKAEPGPEFKNGDAVAIYHFPDLSLPASEFSTDNGSCNSHIQRLG